MPGMMNILMLSLDTSVAQPGSAAHQRHAVYAAAAGALTIITPGTAAPFTAGPLTVHPVGGGKAVWPWRVWLTAARLPRPDLIVTQDLFLTGAAGLLLRRRRIPLLVQNHTYLFNNAAWLLEHPLRNRALLRIAHSVRARADFYRTVNRVERDQYVAAGGDPARCAALPLGTASPAFAEPVAAARLIALRAELGLAAAERVLLWVGYPHPVKRVPLLLTAFQHAAAGDPRLRLVIVGDPAQSADNLPALAAELGIAERVHFAGVRPHADLPAFYQLADVYVHTSSYEGVPRVLIEAGAAGRPVVALRAVGVAEVVIDGVTGVLVDGADPARLAQAITALLADPERRARLGAAAQTRCLIHFDADGYPARWVALWRQAIALGRRP